MQTTGWTLTDWRTAYSEDNVSPKELLTSLVAGLDASDPAWTHIVSPAELTRQLDTLEGKSVVDLPLYGVPFAVKDNIDVAGLPTSAACPSYAYEARISATTVARLTEAGAIVIGKTNLDQFATGLVGTRSPYGAVPNSVNPDYVSGGSSSGSAVVVARGIVPFSLGTDTAGSGRVPAGFNNIVGLKPTKGRFSTRGVVPACRSIDCVSVFALGVSDATAIAQQLEAFDPKDAYSRRPSVSVQTHVFGNAPTLAIPSHIDWCGDDAQREAWLTALEDLSASGAKIITMDFAPMQALAQLLYGGAWVAERGAAVGDFIAKQSPDINPVVGGIISQANKFSAIDVFNAEYRRAELAQEIQGLMNEVDALVVPTTVRFPTQAEVADDPVGVNSQLGLFTNFVNLADCAALSVPANKRRDNLPFGITFIAPAWSDNALAELGATWQQHQPWSKGALSQALTVQPAQPTGIDEQMIRIAVVGAHLRGMPLNHQLISRDARFICETQTAGEYRLYALNNTQPPKPGLARESSGSKIVVELWDMPLHLFGSFVAEIPAPLGIGSVSLADGSSVKGFICEPQGIANATDITEYGGWRNYLNSTKTAANS
ncbi:allophanate hydrolase [Gilvimarinus agarilyticus]|uniref:allophanate hydrolase n=1 Tax=Gilvimarinus agarilyticus TaxID=679259 RepID=UPI0005A2D722|nr:allophanate hydrolase [Gilvimarinus agarilyticus]